MRTDRRYEILNTLTKVWIYHLGTEYLTLLDTEDWLKYKEYAMCLEPAKNSVFYVKTTILSQQFKLHRLIMNCNFNELIDHKDGNGLNNCKTNLRVATNAENMQNRTTEANSNSTSGVRGVGFKSQTGRWTAQVKINGTKKHLGSFKTIEEAEKVVTEYRSKNMPFSKEAMI
jgi:hypothetical protein